MRERLAKMGAIAAIVGVIAALLTSLSTPQSAQAVSAWEFNPEQIVSDAAFYNSNSMTAPQIQQFLQSKVSTCRSGYTCLKDYRQDTWSRGADPMCNAYSGARGESAADIIYKVGKACGVNPQTLIVLLEKEQSLISDDFPTDTQYRKATGYACPDTAPCDATYNGFYNQVYMAAWAFKRYAMPAGTGPGTEWYTRYDLMYPVGRTSAIQYNPNSGCGTKNVFVRNQATHALYVYTPYVPNNAALAAGYGRGDGCSSYGNRNFFLLFNDWFGGPQFEVRGWIGDKYAAVGGGAGVLGAPIENEYSRDDGHVQAFQNGRIYSSIAGAFVVRGWILDKYVSLDGNRSALGWPRADETSSVGGGAMQQFASGRIYSSSAGAFAVTGAMLDTYLRLGGPGGSLGYPAGDTRQEQGKVFQKFTGGTVNLTPNGVVLTRGWIGDKYLALGGPTSWLGWPVGAETATTGGQVQQFERGAIVATPAGAFATSKEIASGYAALGGPKSVVGQPAADGALVTGGSKQRFQNGWLFASSTGVKVVRGWVGDRYLANGAEAGALKWPTDGEKGIRGGAAQTFQGGAIYSSGASGAHAVAGAILQRFLAAGGSEGPLGFPADEATTSGGGTGQAFQGGGVYSSSAGTWIARGWIGDKYRALRAGAGPLGWPRGEEEAITGGHRQAFQSGYIYSSPAGAFEVRGWIGDKYAALGAQQSPLGFPVSDEIAVPGGVRQDYRGGSIYVIPQGAFVTRGWIGDKYASYGASSSAIGFPTGDEVAVPGGAKQSFQRGQVLASAAGAFVARGSIGEQYASLGAERSRLGFPLGDERLTAEGHVQVFQGGRIVANDRGINVYYG